MKGSRDAHEARIACFSCIDMPGATITSSGCANVDGEGYAIAEMASIASWDEADVMPDREPAKFFEGALESEKKANQIEVCRQPNRGPESRGRRFPTRLLSISLYGGFGYEKRI